MATVRSKSGRSENYIFLNEKRTFEFDKTTRHIAAIFNQHDTVAKLIAIIIALGIDALLNVKILVAMMIIHSQFHEERFIWISIWLNAYDVGAIGFSEALYNRFKYNSKSL